MEITNLNHNQKLPFTEVYFWLARDKEGKFTTSSEGGKLEPTNGPDGLARCGHVAMKIFLQNKSSVYISLWPDVWEKKKPSVLIKSFSDDQRNEGGDPNVIICLHRLNIEAMLTEFNKVKNRVDKEEVQWHYKVSDSADVTTFSNTQASCVSFVYTILKAGGFENRSSIYYDHMSARGPKNTEFYQLTKCNVGDILGGFFNGFPWTAAYFTPKGLLLRTASAAEAVAEDIFETTQIMKSNRVENEANSSPHKKIPKFSKFSQVSS